MIEMQQRMLYTPIFHIDTNLINARGLLCTMNQIEKWANDEIILINISGVSYREALAGNNAQRTKKTRTYLHTLTDENSDITCKRYREIVNAIFPQSAKNQNQHNDVRVIFEAAHWNAILVTRDGASKNQPGGILGNRDKLRDIVKLLSDTETVEFIRHKITERDNFNHLVAQETGKILPTWTGGD